MNEGGGAVLVEAEYVNVGEQRGRVWGAYSDGKDGEECGILADAADYYPPSHWGLPSEALTPFLPVAKLLLGGLTLACMKARLAMALFAMG